MYIHVYMYWVNKVEFKNNMNIHQLKSVYMTHLRILADVPNSEFVEPKPVFILGGYSVTVIAEQYRRQRENRHDDEKTSHGFDELEVK